MLFQEQARGLIGEVWVATRRAERIAWLRGELPGAAFRAFPDPDVDGADAVNADAYKRAVAELPPDGVVVVATPDHFHTPGSFVRHCGHMPLRSSLRCTWKPRRSTSNVEHWWQ